MANKDGFRLERIYVGPPEKVARFEIVRAMDFNLQQEYTYEEILTRFSVLYKHIHIYIHEL
jgi:hypothetical protein